MLQTATLKDMTWTDAVELIGKESDKGKIIGVDNRPPKRQDGVWLVLAISGEPISYHRAG